MGAVAQQRSERLLPVDSQAFARALEGRGLLARALPRRVSYPPG